MVALSGMTKQDYCISRMLQQDVVVTGNPQVHKALKNQMERLCQEFERLYNVNEASAEALHVLEYLAKVLFYAAGFCRS